MKWRKSSFSKRLLGLPMGLLVLVAAMVVIAATIGYIMSVDIEGSKEPVLKCRESLDDGSTWSDWELGEDLDFVWDFGTVIEYTGSRLYQIKTSDAYDAAYGSDISCTIFIHDENDALTVIDTSTSLELVDGDPITISQTSGFEFEVSIDIPLWTYSGYDYSLLEVKIVPVI